MKYIYLPQTADIKIKAFGKNLNEVFENSAYAFFDTMVDIKKVKCKIKKTIKISSSSVEMLLFDFLNELLILFEVNDLVFSKFKVKINKLNLVCDLCGEKFNPKKHSSKTLIKAVTFNDMEINNKEAVFVLDA